MTLVRVGRWALSWTREVVGGEPFIGSYHSRHGEWAVWWIGRLELWHYA